MAMENSPKPQERENPIVQTSPKSNGSNSSCSSSSNSNGVQPPLTPKPISRSETTNTYPTTFIQADTTSFKQVVQMLTGSTETAKQASKATTVDPSSQKSVIPPIKNGPKKQGFKLYERRNSLKNLKISPLMPGFIQNSGGFSPRKPEILSPSILDFPSLVLSPVTPLIPDPFNRSPPTCTSNMNMMMMMNHNNSSSTTITVAAEEKAIAEKGFYLHPSPVSTPRDSEPRLLPLFPVTSPRIPGSSS
ncbi:hypothetical protein AQUCO_03600125v1 [Aquilegia coerulea]|uniref:VQ domain-containing protein n=1 Tax=Aquilegia coerulea TaxID=218851 RepID=A0A2G5CVE0_AQUCA|nr:hypothetical protein AQUCO_03600125v1 [Aquilegia coerulea]